MKDSISIMTGRFLAEYMFSVSLGVPLICSYIFLPWIEEGLAKLHERQTNNVNVIKSKPLGFSKAWDVQGCRLIIDALSDQDDGGALG